VHGTQRRSYKHSKSRQHVFNTLGSIQQSTDVISAAMHAAFWKYRKTFNFFLLISFSSVFSCSSVLHTIYIGLVITRYLHMDGDHGDRVESMGNKGLGCGVSMDWRWKQKCCRASWTPMAMEQNCAGFPLECRSI